MRIRRAERKPRIHIRELARPAESESVVELLTAEDLDLLQDFLESRIEEGSERDVEELAYAMAILDLFRLGAVSFIDRDQLTASLIRRIKNMREAAKVDTRSDYSVPLILAAEALIVCDPKNRQLLTEYPDIGANHNQLEASVLRALVHPNERDTIWADHWKIAIEGQFEDALKLFHSGNPAKVIELLGWILICMPKWRKDFSLSPDDTQRLLTYMKGEMEQFQKSKFGQFFLPQLLYMILLTADEVRISTDRGFELVKKSKLQQVSPGMPQRDQV